MKYLFTGVIILINTVSCNYKMQNITRKDFIDAVPGYSKAVVVRSASMKTIYVAGLTGDGNDLESQTRAAFNNIKTELEAVGASMKDVVKMNTYIVNYQPENIEIFRKVRKEIMGETNMPASTVVGVQALAAKNKLIEIEAVAIVNVK